MQAAENEKNNNQRCVTKINHKSIIRTERNKHPRNIKIHPHINGNANNKKAALANQFANYITNKTRYQQK